MKNALALPDARLTLGYCLKLPAADRVIQGTPMYLSNIPLTNSASPCVMADGSAGS
jgi:hypothetical protein